MSHSGPSAVAITLSEAECTELVHRAKLPHRRTAEKARIILACADGMSNAGVERLVGVQAKTVGKWRRAFAAERMAGLEDAGWIGRRATGPCVRSFAVKELRHGAHRSMLAPINAAAVRRSGGAATPHRPESAGWRSAVDGPPVCAWRVPARAAVEAASVSRPALAAVALGHTALATSRARPHDPMHVTKSSMRKAQRPCGRRKTDVRLTLMLTDQTPLRGIRGHLRRGAPRSWARVRAWADVSACPHPTGPRPGPGSGGPGTTPGCADQRVRASR